MPGPLVAPLIMAGSSLLGSGLNAASQGSMNRKTRRWNEKMYGMQRADALADWNMQNEYNSPVSQMQRLRDAKLNPNLVYGNGADAMGGVVRSTNVESWNPQTPRWGDMAAAGGAGLSAYYDTQIKEAQIDNLKTINTVQVQEAALKAAQTAATNIGAEANKFDLSQRQRLADISLQTAEQSLKKIMADIENTGVSTRVLTNRDEREAAQTSSSIAEATARILRMRSQNTTDEVQRRQMEATIKSIEKDGLLKDLDINLRRMGINPSDPTWQRVIAQGIGSLSKLGAPELLKEVYNGSKSHKEAVATLNDRIMKMFGLKADK